MAEKEPSTPVRHLHNGILVGPSIASSAQRNNVDTVRGAVTIPEESSLSFDHEIPSEGITTEFVELDAESLIKRLTMGCRRVFNLFSTSFSPLSRFFQVEASGGGQLRSYSDHHTSEDENLNLINNVDEFYIEESLDFRRRRPVLSVDIKCALWWQRLSLGYPPADPHEQTPENLITMPTSEKALYSHSEQLLMFRGVFGLPADDAGPLLPQKMYIPIVEHKCYLEDTMLEGPLYFISENPQRYGILLTDALNFRMSSLRDRDQAVFQRCGPSVSILLQWPGYRKWSRQIPSTEFCAPGSPPESITLAQLANSVAKCVQHYIQERRYFTSEERADPRWIIGNYRNEIKLEDLMLVSIHHVAPGSWQPHLRLAFAEPPQSQTQSQMQTRWRAATKVVNSNSNSKNVKGGKKLGDVVGSTIDEEL